VKGHVSLVGAGPGDPGLLTRKAIARLRSADLVLYDALIDDRVLKYARRAQKFFVGKRGAHGPREQRGIPNAAAALGCDSESVPAASQENVRRSAIASGGGPPRAQGLSQDAIHALMIRAARRGRRVVRLKGGDPFVFGRGGEEALALQRAGVPYDIVPGVSSAASLARRQQCLNFLPDPQGQASLRPTLPQLEGLAGSRTIVSGSACVAAVKSCCGAKSPAAMRELISAIAISSSPLVASKCEACIGGSCWGGGS